MRSSRRKFGSSVLAALVLAGCNSQLNLTGTPAQPPIESSSTVRATLTAGAAGQLATVTNVSELPAEVKQATNLSVAFAKTKVPVSRVGGGLSFTVPAGTRTGIEANGDWKVVFIMDDRTSRIVTLKTGSPVQYGDPMILTDPSPATLARGTSIKLTANTDATEADYQFAWSYAASAAGPFTPIRGESKTVSWTPPSAGNFFIKIDAVDRKSQVPYSTVSAQAVVFVTEIANAITTSAKTYDRGDRVELAFNVPQAGGGPFTWYVARQGTSATGAPNWTLIPGSEKTNYFLPSDAGGYQVRVDAPQADGSVQSFTTSDSVFTVVNRQPLIQSDPVNQVTSPGGGVTLVLNARGAEEGKYTFLWSVSQSPAGPWTSLPVKSPTDLRSKRYGWTTTPATAPGAYYVRVIASETSGSASYTFISDTPVVTIQTGSN